METVAQAVTPSRRPTALTQEHERFRGIIVPVLGPRVRLLADPEGWPLVPARLGRLEWRGLAPAGRVARVYAFTDRRRMIRPLLAIPDVHRCQTGDGEATVWIAAEDTAALRAVAQLLRTRIRRTPETGASPERMAALRAGSGAPTGL
jgi:hypothetical protein